MTQGRFEKLFTGTLILMTVIVGFQMWSGNLFTTYGVSMDRNLTFFNQTSTISDNLQTLYDDSQPDSGFSFIETALLSGWQAFRGIFSMIGLFLTLPMTIAILLVPDHTTATWIGGIATTLFLAVITWGIISIFLRNEEGTV